jgi:hypothetical protein
VEVPQCSAKACRAPARHVLLWNNPKLHTPDREKPWHACDEHVQHLSEYLGVRGFLLRVELLPEPAEEAPEGPAVPR